MPIRMGCRVKISTRIPERATAITALLATSVERITAMGQRQAVSKLMVSAMACWGVVSFWLARLGFGFAVAGFKG